LRDRRKPLREVSPATCPGAARQRTRRFVSRNRIVQPIRHAPTSVHRQAVRTSAPSGKRNSSPQLKVINGLNFPAGLKPRPRLANLLGKHTSQVT
jgi:hypothetical protein